MLSAKISPRNMALVGNPIRLDVVSSSFVIYTIKVADQLIYSGSGDGSFFVFLEDILATIVTPTKYTNFNNNFILPTIGNLKKYTIVVENSEQEKVILEHTAVVGGISKRAMRHLAAEGCNIFTFKLLNDAGNFFMSTRSETKILKIRETEIVPLVFIAPSDSLTVRVSDDVQKIIPLSKGTCYALNLKALRYAFASENNVFASCFEIVVNGAKAVTIVISKCEVEKERYYLEFLNSYGAYERIDVTGKPILEQEKLSDKTYQVYDIDVNDYVTTRDRVSSIDHITVETGFKGEQELLYILDMLSSSDINLFGYEDRQIKVNASAENLSYAKNMIEPHSLPIKLVFADSEMNFTQPLIAADFGTPRLHSPEFSIQFN